MFTERLGCLVGALSPAFYDLVDGLRPHNHPVAFLCQSELAVYAFSPGSSENMIFVKTSTVGNPKKRVTVSNRYCKNEPLNARNAGLKGLIISEENENGPFVCVCCSLLFWAIYVSVCARSGWLFSGCLFSCILMLMLIASIVRYFNTIHFKAENTASRSYYALGS